MNTIPPQDQILIIDDDPSIRTVLRTFLHAHGYEIHEAENGQAALRLLDHQAIGVVITDIYMPTMDGLEAMRTIRTTRPGIKIIAMSGMQDKVKWDPLPAAQYLGADITLHKPFAPPELLSAVQAVQAAY